ncbi:hypothetical protein Aph01nite_68840 [Acrocarpospora phusangensis]|uniref:DUF1707 domain-containing protein n=1 Tax=Acrocarpospora phusangensis TaxID=1070424 RepID=A0A919QGA6_9ACTN|nr:hypothetical protein Aph01nite_68840 [Acrocarpospora phusangensis]
MVEHVKVAYAEGRLDKDEMDERLHLAMTARTHADLMPIMTDLYGSRPPFIPPPPPLQRMASPVMPQPLARDSTDRVVASAAHLISLTGLFIVGPLIMLLTAGKTSPYVRKHAVESLNFHLTVLGASILLPITVVGLILVPFVWVAGIVLAIVGGISALSDSEFRYPFTLRLIK